MRTMDPPLTQRVQLFPVALLTHGFLADLGRPEQQMLLSLAQCWFLWLKAYGMVS